MVQMVLSQNVPTVNYSEVYTNVLPSDFHENTGTLSQQWLLVWVCIMFIST